MLALDFSFNGSGFGGLLKKQFADCRVSLFDENGSRVRICFIGEQGDWLSFWTAVWRLTECGWFASSVTEWRLTVCEDGGTITENLLEYCLKNRKGLFKARGDNNCAVKP